MLRKTAPKGILFKQGGLVIYWLDSKRDGAQKWRGPGFVIGQDEQTLFLRHGGVVFRVHAYRARHVIPAVADPNTAFDYAMQTASAQPPSPHNEFSLDDLDPTVRTTEHPLPSQSEVT